MRSLVALGVVAAALSLPLTADARKPARQEIDFFDDAPPEPCPRGKTWPVVQRCLDKYYRAQKSTVDVVFDTGKLKVVSAGPTADARQLLVYSLLETEWRRGSVIIRANNVQEVLRIEVFATPLGDAVRVDVGTSTRSGFSIAPGAVVRGVLRRRTSHVCLPGGGTCRSVVTACEAYAHGKAYFVFNGELVWHATLGLRLRGNSSHAGSVCRPSAGMILDDDDA